MDGKEQHKCVDYGDKQRFVLTRGWQYMVSSIRRRKRMCKGTNCNGDNHLISSITSYPSGAHTGVHKNLTTTTNSNGWGTDVNIYWWINFYSHKWLTA